MRRLLLPSALLVVLAACKHVAGGGDANADAASDAAVDAGQDPRGGLTLIPSGPPHVPVIDFTPDASASPEDRRRALASLLAGASPAGNLAEEATDPDAGFEYFQYSHLTQQEVELAPSSQGEVQMSAPTVTVPIANVERVVAGLRSRFRACYRAGVASDPSMTGKLTLTAVVLPNGEVGTVDVAQNTGLSPSVASCAARGLKNTTFDSPGGSSGSIVTVPITFVLKK